MLLYCGKGEGGIKSKIILPVFLHIEGIIDLSNENDNFVGRVLGMVTVFKSHKCIFWKCCLELLTFLGLLPTLLLDVALNYIDPILSTM